MYGGIPSGEFGNRSPTWNGWLDWNKDHLGSDKFELFHIRNRVAGAMTWYDVPKFKMADTWDIACQHFSVEQLYISAMCPTELTQIQGEVMRTAKGLYLYYSTVKKPMRQSLLEGGQEALGLFAVSLLQYYMDQNSWEWLNHLLDSYEDHVVEFTTLSKRWGAVEGYNTLFWEVRKF